MKTDYTNARNAYDPKFIRFERISDNGMVDLSVRVSGTEDAPVTATFRDEFFGVLAVVERDLTHF